MVDLVVSGTCNARTFHSFLHQRRDPDICRVDLGQMTFAYPEAVVGICAVMSHALESGRHVEMVIPTSRDAANYLSRVRLPGFLDEMGISHSLPTVRERDLGDNLLELRKFESTDDVGELGEHLERAVAASSRETARALYVAALETGANVMDHSKQACGFVMAQRTHSRTVVNFAVGDAGIGVLGSLRNVGATGERDALQMAMKGGVSATGKRGRGNGLRSLTDGVVSLGGSITLASGSTQRTESSPNGSAQIRSRSNRNKLRGTIISGAIPIAA